MIAVLLVIVCSYSLAAAAVHVASRFGVSREPRAKHFVLLAGNHQLQMEWYMRSLQWHARWFGKEVRVTVVNHGSEDETMDIARLFARSGMDVRFRGNMPAANGAGWEGSGKSGSEPNMAGNNSAERQDSAGTRLPLSKWQRFRLMVNKRSGSERTAIDSGAGGEGASRDGSSGTGDEGASRDGGLGRGDEGAGRDGSSGTGSDCKESSHLYWMTQSGIVTDREQAVLVDLRDPEHISKLPL